MPSAKKNTKDTKMIAGIVPINPPFLSQCMGKITSECSIGEKKQEQQQGNPYNPGVYTFWCFIH